MKTIVEKSFKSCIEKKIDPNIKRPLVSASQKEMFLINKCTENMNDAFRYSCSSFISKLKDDVVIILTDSNGTLISSIGSNKILSKLRHAGLDVGISFLEDSIGTNAISIAMEAKKSIFLEPENHYCNILKNWHCFATPLIFENKIVGYLDVSTLNESMKNEIKIIAELLPYKIIVNMSNSNKINSVSKQSNQIKVSSRQKEIMNMLIVGLTEKQIAMKLFIALPTVKYHKSKIFEKLEVKNTNQFIKKYYEIEKLLCS